MNKTNIARGTISDIHTAQRYPASESSPLDLCWIVMKNYLVLPQENYQFSARNRSVKRKNVNNIKYFTKKESCNYQRTLLYKKLMWQSNSDWFWVEPMEIRLLPNHCHTLLLADKGGRRNLNMFLSSNKMETLEPSCTTTTLPNTQQRRPWSRLRNEVTCSKENPTSPWKKNE